MLASYLFALNVVNLGLVGYVTYAAGYLLILGSSYASAFILPTVAETDPGGCHWPVPTRMTAACGRCARSWRMRRARSRSMRRYWPSRRAG